MPRSNLVKQYTARRETAEMNLMSSFAYGPFIKIKIIDTYLII